MAKVTVTYDTKTKEFMCQMDGEMVENLQKVEFYCYKSDEKMKASMELYTSKSTEEGMLETMRIYASDATKEGVFVKDKDITVLKAVASEQPKKKQFFRELF
jgi:hypothetical protein